jgi:hypothetical protein
LKEHAAGRSAGRVTRRGRLLLVNQKRQKNFFHLGRAGFTAAGPAPTEVFGAACFKTAAAFLFSFKPVTP